MPSIALPAGNGICRAPLRTESGIWCADKEGSGVYQGDLGSDPFDHSAIRCPAAVAAIDAASYVDLGSDGTASSVSARPGSGHLRICPDPSCWLHDES